MIEVLFAALSVYGIATMLAEYDGPAMIFSTLRKSKIGKLFSCSVCMLPWLTAIFAIALGLDIFESLAAIGLAMILARNL